MSAPTLTYTVTNGSTADATQVMQNFNDLLNGITDGTKDLTISALTCAGNASFQGNVTLGNGTPDDITVSGSLASSIPIKTTNSYDIGTATLGLQSVYFGSSGGAFSTRIKGAAVTSSYTLTTPLTGGSAGQLMRTNGSGTLFFVNPPPGVVLNYSIAVSVGSNALTVALKAADGSDASATNPIDAVFRNSAVGTGTSTIRQVTGALSMTVSSGSTLGHSNALMSPIYVYLIDNSGTVELAVATGPHSDELLISTSAEGGAGAADSISTIYSTTARSNVPAICIAKMESTQTTAGTWATAPTNLVLMGRVGMVGNEPIICQINQASQQNVNNASTTKITNMSTRTLDSHTFWDTTNNQAVLPAGGMFEVIGGISWGANATGSRVCFISVVKSGSTTSGAGRNAESPGNATENCEVQANYAARFAAGDNIYLEGYQSSTATLATSTSYSATYIIIKRVGK